MIDSHAHSNFKAFDKDWKEVIRRAEKTGVKKIIIVGTDWESSQRAVLMSQKNSNLYASVGMHPHHAKSLVNFNDYSEKIENLIKKLESLVSKNKKIIAIGEIGMDFHEYRNTKYKFNHDKEIKRKIKLIQQLLLAKQVGLAAKYNKSLIIHSRQAKGTVSKSIIKISRKNNWKARGVFHCFEGNEDYLKKIIDSGFQVSFTGNITFDKKHSKLASKVPLENLLLETDCPYMSPTPHKGERNEPSYVKIIARHHAISRKLHINEVIKRTENNTCKLFNI